MNLLLITSKLFKASSIHGEVGSLWHKTLKVMTNSRNTQEEGEEVVEEEEELNQVRCKTPISSPILYQKMKIHLVKQSFWNQFTLNHI